MVNCSFPERCESGQRAGENHSDIGIGPVARGELLGADRGQVVNDSCETPPTRARSVKPEASRRARNDQGATSQRAL